MIWREYGEKLKNSKFFCGLKEGLRSDFFPFITAAVLLVFYYAGLDLVNIWYIAICGILVLLLLEDITPIITLFLFMNVMISRQHSPSFYSGSSNYLFQPAVFTQIIVLVSLFVAAIFYRVALSVKRGTFRTTPTFYGLCAFAAALLVNGLFMRGYSPVNLFYGLLLAFSFLGIFVLCCGNIKFDAQTFERLACSFLALGCLLLIELTVAYATTDGLIVDGEIKRELLVFGWGIWNTMGSLFCLCIPSALFLAGKRRHGWAFTLVAIVLLFGAIFSMSRQAMLSAAVVFVCGAVALIIKGNYRTVNIIIFAAVAAVSIIYVAVEWEYFATLFSWVARSFAGGNGRLERWYAALDYFKSYPVFGAGFFGVSEVSPEIAGPGVIPWMVHNTVLQLMGACGAVGLITYAVHRTQTVISYIKNVTYERTYIALTILALLIVSLLDNHLFYILPTLVYGMLTAVLVQSENLVTLKRGKNA